MNVPVILISLSIVLTAPSHALISWIGATSSDIFDESNWDLSASTVTTIDPNVTITDDVLIGSGPFANSPVIPEVANQQRFQLADGQAFSLIGPGAVLSVAGNDGVGGELGSVNGPRIFVTDGASFGSFFVVNDARVMIDSLSSATFGGGGNPINLSILDLAPGATVTFLAEIPEAFIAEHLGKTFVNGAPAVIGVNLELASNGAAGSIITASGVIPEPSISLMLMLAGLGFLVRRRK